MNKDNNTDIKDTEIKPEPKEPTTENKIEREIKIDPTTQKFIPLTPVSNNLKNKLLQIINALLLTRQEVFAKRETLSSKRQLIKEKISSLIETKKVRLDKNEFEQSEKSASNYIKLLDGVIDELSNEIGYYLIFTSDEKPAIEKIVVPLNAPNELEDYLNLQIEGMKRHLKTVKSNVSVSCSRYSFGCDEQLKHLSFVESYIKTKELEKKS